MADTRKLYEDAFLLSAGPKGSLSQSETLAALQGLGFGATAAEVAADGSTNLDGFLALAQKYAARGAADDSELYEAFRSFDKLGNGSVAAKEFCQYASILGDRLNQEEIDSVMSFANNGSINYESLIKTMQNRS